MFKLLLFPIFASGIFLGGLVVNQIRYSQLQKCRQEKLQVEEAYRSTKVQAEECISSMQKLKVDYQKRVKAFIKAMQERSKYEALKDIRTEEKDECQALKSMLDSYRDIELK